FPEPDRIVAVGMRAGAAAGRGEGSQPAARGGPQGSRPMAAMPGAKPPDPDALMSVTPHDYLDWADRQQVFQSLAAITYTGDAVFHGSNAEPEVVKGQRVTARFFDVLCARPLLGEVFTSQDELAGSDRVVVVSHGFWRRHLDRNPTVVGRSLMLNDEAYTIVGVMPARFAYPPGSSQLVDVWLPSVMSLQDRAGSGSGARQLGGVEVIARLRPGVSLEQARAQMSQVTTSIVAANTPTSSGRRIGLRPLRDHLVGSSTRMW